MGCCRSKLVTVKKKKNIKMTAKIIALTQAKGGVGKSTLCINLASTFSDKHKVLIIDCDPPQHSVIAWADVRQEKYEDVGLSYESVSTPAELLNRLEEKANQYDLILLDGPPHVSAMTKTMVAIASMALIPLAPSKIEIWSFEQMEELIKSASSINPDLVARIVWTRVRKRVQSSTDLMEQLKKDSSLKALPAQITQRVAYVDSFAEGVSVYEWKDAVARAEIWSLTSALQRLLKKNKEYHLRDRPGVLKFSRS